MATRENQGLQIALILFVMITIALAVANYFFYTKTQESVAAKNDMEQEMKNANNASREKIQENGKLKVFMGFSAEDKVDVIEKEFEKDMHTFPAGYAETPINYRTLPKFLIDEIRKSDSKYRDSQQQVDQLAGQLAAAQKKHQAALASVQQGFTQSTTKFTTDLDALTAARREFEAQTAGYTNQLNDLRKAITKKEDEHRTQIARLEAIIAKEIQLRKMAEEQVRRQSTETFERPQGEITQIRTAANSVWLNLGAADGLKPQTSFSVHPPGTANVAKSTPKASVEVTRILGDRLAEARIINDDYTNPIRKGDLVFSPTWKAGQKTHFALAGFMDITGNNSSDRSKVRSLIFRNGGIIDAEVDDDGRRTGQLSYDTRYLVIGKRPTEKASAEAISAFSAIQKEATNLNVEIITLDKLLNLMGYEGGAHSITVDDRGADTRARPDDGVIRRSTGSTADTPGGFAPRRPSAYDR
jgi:hypothetical protein